MENLMVDFIVEVGEMNDESVRACSDDSMGSFDIDCDE